MKKCTIALLFSGLLLSTANAADIGTSYKSPILAPVAARDWTGLYGGVNVGYGFGAGGRDNGGQTANANNNPAGPADFYLFGVGGPAWNSSNDLKGVLGGIQFGYNRQLSKDFVAGVETDFQFSGLSGDGGGSQTTEITLSPALPGLPDPLYWPLSGTARATQKINGWGTLRGRLGVTSFDQSLLVYGTGGLAYGQVKQNFTYVSGFLPNPLPPYNFSGTNSTGTASSTKTQIGWVLGAGLEWAPVSMPNWSFKAEYLYVNLGSTTVNLTAPAFRNSDGDGNRTVSASNRMDAAFQTVRVGVNYRFN
ncbi:MAG: OmpW family protein [Hyphomicrobiales bacterium]|nr:OmpW family protein [Hyphomicrobiales bacterium]